MEIKREQLHAGIPAKRDSEDFLHVCCLKEVHKYALISWPNVM